MNYDEADTDLRQSCYMLKINSVRLTKMQIVNRTTNTAGKPWHISRTKLEDRTYHNHIFKTENYIDFKLSNLTKARLIAKYKRQQSDNLKRTF